MKKVSLFFELSEAYSNYACRLHIDVEFFDFEAFTDRDKRSVHKFFHNYGNATGQKFISFIYKSQRARDIDIEEIKSFIYHYEFSKNIFNGFIKNILSENCSLEVISLETEPFFNYFDRFLMKSKYSKENDEYSFRKAYMNLTKSEFEFDCYYHDRLIQASTKELESKQNAISDKELSDENCCNNTDIRRFIVENKVPFSIGYSTTVIDNIIIDTSILKEKMKMYTPNPYSSIKPTTIINLIENKEQKLLLRKQLLQTKSSVLGIQIGDYVYIEDKYDNERFLTGVIKEIDLSYNDELEIKYNILKKDSSESKLPLKTASDKDIFYFLKAEIFEEEKNKVLITKESLTKLFQTKGVKNVLSKIKKKK
ncbi:hypothetical protein [Chryseobacterium scophthalmum]|uniref:hypothetical protein n=1 Tax=Chryseobacterium scophthalmum TaxID=59733 RepID=UPI00117EB9AB|nr:hypothetical protein [Chryseobacterium scophthalmum]